MNVSDELDAEKHSVSSDDKVLLSECTVTTFRSSGKGGQHVNKTDSAVRIRHDRSGIVVTCQRERSQYLNKMICIKKLRCKLESMLEKKSPRVTTKVPKTVKVKRKIGKIIHGQKKIMRKMPPLDE